MFKFIKKFKIIIIYVIAVTIVFRLGWEVGLRAYEKYTKVQQLSIQALSTERQISYVFMIRDERRKCIAKTLQLAYGISKWEAFCYAMFFDEFAVLYKTDWELYGAVIRVETNYDPTLKSEANCKGLMQLKESTAREVANKIHIDYTAGKTLWNDIINFALGATYLSEFIEKRGIEGAIKSYLGGPNYKKNAQKKKETFLYVRQYKLRVSEEYNQLKYMYRGIVDEHSVYKYDQIINSVKSDTSALVFDVFKR